MRLAVLSDIHGNLIALEAALEDLNSAGDVDLIWCLGDLAAFGTRPAECVARLRELQAHYGDKKFQVIGGNTDRYLITGERMRVSPPRFEKDEEATSKADRIHKRLKAFEGRDHVLNWNLSKLSVDDFEYLAGMLGRELRHSVAGYGVVWGVHAAPGDDEGMALRPDSPQEEALDSLLDRAGKLMLVGHTHLQMDRDLGRWRVINPGSVGMSFSQPGKAEWALLTFNNGVLHVDLRTASYDVEKAISEANTLGHPVPEMVRERLRGSN